MSGCSQPEIPSSKYPEGTGGGGGGRAHEPTPQPCSFLLQEELELGQANGPGWGQRPPLAGEKYSWRTINQRGSFRVALVVYFSINKVFFACLDWLVNGKAKKSVIDMA